MVIKERRTKILLALYLLSTDGFSPLNFDEKIRNIFDLSFNQKTRGTIAAMIKEGSIEKNGEADNRYALTKNGFRHLCLEFPFFRYQIDQWDGKWRILSYEIPEKKRELRDRLRRKVAGWGLGPWHRSFWLTPHPIIDNLKDLISQKEEEKYVQAFASDHVFGDRQILIEKVWAKSQLDKKYRRVFKAWHDILSAEGDKNNKLADVINEYVNILRQDPGLPKELVGEQWIGFEANNIFKEIKSILLI